MKSGRLAGQLAVASVMKSVKLAKQLTCLCNEESGWLASHL